MAVNQMSGKRLLSMAPTKVGRFFARLVKAQQKRSATIEAEVLQEYIDFYQRELARVQRRQAHLTSELNRLK